jgi:hypothetical protein
VAVIAPQRLPSPASVRVGRLSSLLFHFRAADLDVTQALSGQLLTFARAGGDAYSTDATGRVYVNPYGQARFGMHDYDGDGIRETPGLVLEPSKTNILLQSDNVPNASWTKTRSSAVLVSGIAPDGGSLSLLKEDATASSTHLATQVVTITAGDYLTISVFVKAKERTKGYLQAVNGADVLRVLFDLAAVTVTVSNGGTSVAVDSGIKDEGNGVYRVWITGQVNAGSTSITCGLGLRDASGNASYSGDGASGMYFWRADFKDGSGTGSELWSGIGTTTATVTRAAESLAATLAWPFQDSLTLYAKVARPDWYLHSGSLQTSHFPLSLSDTAPYLRMFYNASTRVAGAQVNDGSGNISVTLSQPTTTPNELCMQATGLKSGGTIRLDVGGGFGSPSAAVAPFTALGDAIIRVGASGAGAGLMGSAIHTLKVAAGLRSLAEMQRMS